MEFLYYIFLGMTPAIFCLWYFYQKDKWEPEPKWQVSKIFLIGIVSIIPAGIIEFGVHRYFFLNISYEQMKISLILNVTVCFLVIAPIEELFKYSVVKAFIYHRKDFNEKVDGVVYMVAAAMGFSALENIMYIFRAGFHGIDLTPDVSQATYVGVLRGLLATPAHALFSGFLGVYIGKARFAKSKSQALGLTIIGFLIAICLHGLYNSLIFAGQPYGFGVVPLLLIAGFFLMKNVKQLVDESPFKPKEQTSTQQEVVDEPEADQ